MSLSLLRKGESTTEKQLPLPPPPREKKKKEKKWGYFFREHLSFHCSICSLLWNDPGWRKQNTRLKWYFYSLLLNSKPDGVFDSGYNWYKEWQVFYRKSQVISSQFCFFLFLLTVLYLSLMRKLTSREICIVFYHFKFKYTQPQLGLNPTNYPKDMIQVYYIYFYFANPSNNFF